MLVFLRKQGVELSASLKGTRFLRVELEKRVLELEGQIKMEEMCFSHLLKIEICRSLHQEGTVNEKVCERIKRRSFAERKLQEGT